ncbi:MAG: aspartyl-tRNA synthetase [Candidatus Levybacteria bacterium GW2011_GWA1_39_32]|nr:MAG: aspartyl-tRNA synthetase [Candidatus Levybacteria bacterium GW2011_GWA1_39_32]
MNGLLPIIHSVERLLAGKNIGEILTTQYDLVCNGLEAGGGSIRAHTPELLKATYKIMGYSDSQIEESVGHMLEAFSFGAPPHGGIALGIDRHIALLKGELSIKETMAFPMTSSGRTSVMDAPASVPENILKELGIKVISDDKVSS